MESKSPTAFRLPPVYRMDGKLWVKVKQSEGMKSLDCVLAIAHETGTRHFFREFDKVKT